MKKLKFNGASVDSGFLTAVKLVTTLSSVAQTKILSVGLSLTDYGTYSQINIIISIMTSVLLLGFGDAVNYFYNSKSANDSKVYRETAVNTIFAIEIGTGLFAAALLILARNGVSGYFSNEAVSPLIWIIALKPMLDNIISLYLVLFVSEGRAKLIAGRNFLIAILKLAITYIAVIELKSLEAILTALIALDVIQLITFWGMFSKYGYAVNPFKGSLKCVKNVLSYCLPMGVYAFTNTLIRETDKLIIGRLSSAEELAIYTNCSKVLPFDIVSVSFATVLIPYIMKFISTGEFKRTVPLFKNYIRIGYYSSWILGAAVIMCSKEALLFLYSEDYVSGLPIFVIYIFDSMIKFASMHLIITANGNTKYLMTASLISLGGNIVLNIGLYYAVGNLGPAIATLIVTLVYTLTIIRKSLKILKVKPKDIFDFRDMISFALILSIMAIVGALCKHTLINQGLNSILSMLLCAGSFCLLALGVWHKRILGAMKAVNEYRM